MKCIRLKHRTSIFKEYPLAYFYLTTCIVLLQNNNTYVNFKIGVFI